MPIEEAKQGMTFSYRVVAILMKDGYSCISFEIDGSPGGAPDVRQLRGEAATVDPSLNLARSENPRCTTTRKVIVLIPGPSTSDKQTKWVTWTGWSHVKVAVPLLLT